MVVLWTLRLQPVPQISSGFVLALLPVALFHTIGHVTACVSFSQVGSWEEGPFEGGMVIGIGIGTGRRGPEWEFGEAR